MRRQWPASSEELEALVETAVALLLARGGLEGVVVRASF
jgi:hypothetical protein